MIRDKYRIDAFIATGSMANVYAATHRNGSRVALKVLHRELASEPSLAERFRREGYFANAIGHPGIVRAIDDDMTEDGCAFIVMELLDGENLEERRRRLGGRIPLGEALHVADAMLEVLSAAHDHEILHRDLKPENVFITRKNEVKLLDFGVARFNDGRSSSEMTGIGMVLGTPAFMPPEQALGRREEVDARSDIWSVGATLFTVIAGEAVHIGGDAKTKLIATARTPARPLRDVVAAVPRAVAAVIDRALAFDRAERWADAKAMREALRWARMSLEGEEAQSLERPTLEPEAPPVPTTRASADEPEEPTLANRSPLESYDDASTQLRRPPRPVIRKRSGPPASGPSDDVVTSAPPITQREVRPPSMPPSEGPAFSLRRTAPPPDLVPEAPVTQRLPGPPLPGPSSQPPPANLGEETRNERPRSEPPPDAGAIFRAALARAGAPDLATLPRFDTRNAIAEPRPAAGMPAELPAQLTTAQGLGPSQNGNTTAAMPAASPHTSPPPMPPLPSVMVEGEAPPQFPGYGPPPHDGSAYPSAPPMDVPPTATDTVRGRAANGAPGPLLSTIAPRKGGGILRIVVPIVIGSLVGGAAYLAVTRRIATTDVRSEPAAAASSVAAPPPSASVVASAAPSASALASAAPATSSSAVAVAPKPRKRRPKPPPSATTATATATTTATTAEPTAEPSPPPPPPPPPPPVPTDSLPRKEDLN